MRNLTLADLDDADRRLVQAALEASGRAYAPYSGFAVGAAARARSGATHRGANLENASYGLSLCAEAVAIGTANAAGDHAIEAIAVTGRKFGQEGEDAMVVMPCGRCRQIIAEAAGVSRIDVRVLACSGDLGAICESTISELLPLAFGPAALKASR
jgi:cytidine deaminase